MPPLGERAIYISISFIINSILYIVLYNSIRRKTPPAYEPEASVKP